MFETLVAMAGKVVSEPVRHTFTSGDQKTSFRLMSVERRLNRETHEWGDGDRLFLTVNCWRRLAEGAAMSLVKGDNILVSGRLYTRSYTTEAGERRETYEIDARALGPDLAWCTVVVERPRRPERSLVDLSPDVSIGAPGEEVVAQRAA